MKPEDMIKYYDEEAEATGWFGPEVLFGLTYRYIKQGRELLDIGIGTGLVSALYHKAGLNIHGMDISKEMLNASRLKMPECEYKQHDLKNIPYPFSDESMDIIVCAGVMNFFKDISSIFTEARRILSKDGLFAFIIGYRNNDENGEITIDSEHTHSEKNITMYRHSQNEIYELAAANNLEVLRSLEFIVYMDRKKNKINNAKAFVLQK